MPVTLKKQRDGETWRPCWYGEYTESDGKRKVVNLNVKWKGTPPEYLRLPGSKEFQCSREEAEGALARYVEDARHKGRAEHLVERLIESKTGEAPEYVALADMQAKWLAGSDYSKGYIAQCEAVFRRFLGFMQTQNPKAAFVYQIREKDALAFAKHIRDVMSPPTAKAYIGILRPAFTLCLPAGAPNPFKAGKRAKKSPKQKQDEESIHRKPFSETELEALIAAANGDVFMGDLITAAACTGMRRGDVCNLKWANVDLVGGWLIVKTSKTGETVELPVFPRLRPVLERRTGNGSPFVFPEAARMLDSNPDGLTYRFKKIVAHVFSDDDAKDAPHSVAAADIEAEAADAIREHVPQGDRRNRMLETLRRYCAGDAVRQIEKATGHPRSTIAADCHAVEGWIGKHFMRNDRGTNVKKAIARTTRVSRERGQRAASVRDWHALRTTFVTIALMNGAEMETIQKVTGHKTVSIVLKNYFRPDREQQRKRLAAALPDTLTGRTPKRLPPAEELAALAGKLAAGTVTEKEKARLRKLAAKVR